MTTTTSSLALPAIDGPALTCTGVSFEHADGSTECSELDCDLPHEWHDHHASCSELLPPCPCSPEEHEPPLVYAAAA